MNIFHPLELFADFLTYNFFNLPKENPLGIVVQFFIADTVKIFILLFVIIFIISLIRSYIPPEKIRSILSRKNKYVGNVLASLLGIFTPFCTCSAIPLFLGFIQAGIPLGTTFSFLVSSPMINEVALILLLGLFGWKIALIYVISGLIISIVSGIIIGKMKMEHLIEPFVFQNSIKNNNIELPKMLLKDKIEYAKEYTLGVIKKIWIFVLMGIGIGAFIHGYIPTDFLAQYAGSNNWYAVPLAVLVGIPLYSNAAGVIPLVSALTEKGVAIGTTLAFMMSVTALSFPEFMILKKIMKVKLILIFAGIVGMGIILTGYLYNLVLS